MLIVPTARKETTMDPQVKVAALNIAERLRGAKNAFSQITSDLTVAIDDMRKDGDLPEVCRAYKEIADTYEGMDKQRKEIYALVERMSRETIPELLADAQVTNITVEYGDLRYRFGKTQRVSVSMPDKIGGMEWLRKNGGEGLIQETVNASSLSSFAKDLLKSQGRDMPPEMFTTSTLIYTSVTKA